MVVLIVGHDGAAAAAGAGGWAGSVAGGQGGAQAPGGAGQSGAGGGGAPSKLHPQVELLRKSVNIQRVV
jgi:hypothetical protein